MQMQSVTLNFSADRCDGSLYVFMHGKDAGLPFLSFTFKLIRCFSELEHLTLVIHIAVQCSASS